MASRSIFALSLSAAVSGKVFFSEEFNEGWQKRWVESDWKAPENAKGVFKASAGKWFADEAMDTGLQTTEDSRFYTISANFPEFSNEGKTTIFQFQVKHEQNIECGGGYLKFGPKIEDQKKFGDPTPYNIMFGPDMCGYSKRTHLIFSYKGKNLLKKDDLPYHQDSTLSHVYRLVLRSDNTCRVEVDGEKVYDGSLYEDWEFLLPKTIADPSDKKPEDWVDEKELVDPEDKKPENWEDKDLIPDSNAVMPDVWDEEEDGTWEPPMISNPDYKGEWKPKKIPNPAYKGEWKAREIDNPDYVYDDAVYKFEKFGFVGIDVWQVKAGTIFDNILITDDVATADEYLEKFKALKAVEEEKKKENDERLAEEALKASEEGGEDDDDDLDGEMDDTEL